MNRLFAVDSTRGAMHCIYIRTLYDTLMEGNETFTVSLTTPVLANLLNTVTVVIITNGIIFCYHVYTCTSVLFSNQTIMSVLLMLTTVPVMLPVPIHQRASPVHVTRDTVVMGSCAWVSHYGINTYVAKLQCGLSSWIIEPLDMDECASGADNCGTTTVCVNIDGSFTCICTQGYSGDMGTCIGEPVNLILHYPSENIHRGYKSVFIPRILNAETRQVTNGCTPLKSSCPFSFCQ